VSAVTAIIWPAGGWAAGGCGRPGADRHGQLGGGRRLPVRRRARIAFASRPV